MTHNDVYTTTIVPLMDKLKRYGVRLERDPEELEDLVQSTMLQAWEKIDQLKDGADAEKWLRTIMHRLVIDKLRKPRLPTVSLDDVPTDTEQFISEVDETRAELWHLVFTLSLDDQEVLILRAKRGMTFHEIGKDLGIDYNAAAQRYYRAAERLGELAC